MKYIDEYRDRHQIDRIVEQIKKTSHKPATFMEVCGGHTMAIQKFGIPSLLPENINLVSGPGCPVCVTSRRFIDHAIALSKLPGVIIATFGDLVRVPGSVSTLEKERAQNASVRIVYSPIDALNLAVNNPDKEVIFLGIGFETTVPGTALVLKMARQKQVMNFSVLSSHKVMPPAMLALIDEGIKIEGYIAPGHVTTVTGISMYQPIVDRFGIGCVVSGFEPVDLLQSILMLVLQVEHSLPAVENQYKRVVKAEGNLKAWQMVIDVFEYRDDWWRGLGVLHDSGLGLKEEYGEFDAEKKFRVDPGITIEPKGCICGAVLKGIKKPTECKLFGTACTPSSPVGACMVSNEGACAAYFRYRADDN